MTNRKISLATCKVRGLEGFDQLKGNSGRWRVFGRAPHMARQKRRGPEARAEPPRLCAVGALEAPEQAAANRSGPAIRRASLRIVLHQLSAVLCA